MLLQLGDLDPDPKPTFWMTGYPTKGLADAERVSVLGPAVILEPKAYVSTINIKRTIRAFRLVTREEIKQVETATSP